MRFLFLNQYFPPDPAPTGVLLHELATELESAGHVVQRVSAGAAYRGGQAQGGRMRREATALLRILWAGLRAPCAAVILSASSPPCLLVIATLIAKWHRGRSVHWAMDLYPELAVALGEVKEGLLTRALSALTGWCYRQTDLVVALDADMAAHLWQRYQVKSEIIRPWVFDSILPRLMLLRAAPPRPLVPWTWIYSGNLGRAHEWETLLAAQQEIEKRDGEVQLVFQGRGPGKEAAQERARAMGLQRCVWRDYADEDLVADSLLACHAGVVTQRTSAQGLLWPSKLSLLLSLPRSILWVGARGGSIASELSSCANAGVFTPGDGVAVADWLLGLKRAEPEVAPALDPLAEKRASLARWMSLLSRPTEAPVHNLAV